MMNHPLNEDLLEPGHVACPGCGAAIAMKFALRALGPQTIVVIPACCWGIIAGPYPQSSLKVPILQTAFATGGAVASGLRAALDMRGDNQTNVVTWAGDGGTFDIGFQALSGAVERNEDFIYVCYDNEAYMNTGVQRSSATPFATRTTTTPASNGKATRKKNIIAALAAHRIPYAASANIAYPQDLMAKFSKARALRGGTRFIHVLAPCATGWGLPSELTVKIARLATQTNVFPLYEVEGGIRYTLNHRGELPVREYITLQGRFRHLQAADIDRIQAMVDEDWHQLNRQIALNGEDASNRTDTSHPSTS